MPVPVDPFNFTAGDTAVGDQVDARFAPLYSAMDGALDDDNIDALTQAKLIVPCARRHRLGEGEAYQQLAGGFGTVNLPTVAYSNEVDVSVADTLKITQAGVYLTVLNAPVTVSSVGLLQIRVGGSPIQSAYAFKGFAIVTALMRLSVGNLVTAFYFNDGGAQAGVTGVELSLARLAT